MSFDGLTDEQWDGIVSGRGPLADEYLDAIGADAAYPADPGANPADSGAYRAVPRMVSP